MNTKSNADKKKQECLQNALDDTTAELEEAHEALKLIYKLADSAPVRKIAENILFPTSAPVPVKLKCSDCKDSGLIKHPDPAFVDVNCYKICPKGCYHNSSQ